MHGEGAGLGSPGGTVGFFPRKLDWEASIKLHQWKEVQMNTLLDSVVAKPHLSKSKIKKLGDERERGNILKRQSKIFSERERI